LSQKRRGRGGPVRGGGRGPAAKKDTRRGGKKLVLSGSPSAGGGRGVRQGGCLKGTGEFQAGKKNTVSGKGGRG